MNDPGWETSIVDDLRLSRSMRRVLRSSEDRADAVVTIGWPVRFVTLTTEGGTDRWAPFVTDRSVESRFDRDGAAPRIAVGPLLLDVAAWSVALVASALALAGARGIVRRWRGRCATCGHDARHAPSAVCNECGHRWSALMPGRLLLPLLAALALVAAYRLEHVVVPLSSYETPGQALLGHFDVEHVRRWTFLQEHEDPPRWCIAGLVPRWSGAERALLICINGTRPERMQLQLVRRQDVGGGRRFHRGHTLVCELPADSSPDTISMAVDALVRRFDDAGGLPWIRHLSLEELLDESRR